MSYDRSVPQKLFVFPLAALLVGFCLTWGAAAPKKKSATKAPAAKTAVKSTSKTTAKKAPATKSTTARRYTPGSRSTTYARGRTQGRSPKPVASRRYYGQQNPTPDRFNEIQQALSSRGYLQSTPNGTWDAASVEALKRFQGEQNLPPTGKITSLSLIALGLGPKRNTLTTANPTPLPVQ